SWPRPATHEAGPDPRAATNRCDGAVAKRRANPGDNRVARTRYGWSALLPESRAMFPRQKPDSIPRASHDDPSREALPARSHGRARPARSALETDLTAIRATEMSLPDIVDFVSR